MVVLKPNVVRGGRAIGLGNNLYLMKGRTHSKGGIDIGKNPKTGLEVENNEVMQVSPQGVRVFSAQPILGGISPAQYILGGANPNQVFNAQEQWKKVNRINDDGTKKARFGTPISPSPNIIQYAEGFGESLKNKNFAKKVVKFYKKHSSKIPDKVHKIVYDTLKDTAFSGNMSDIVYNVRHNIKNEVNSDNVFLMPQDRQQKALEKLGYKKIEGDDYGLVNAAVQKYKEATGREVPIYQKGEDEITREELIPLDNADLYSPTGSFREVITPWGTDGAETKVITDNEDIGDTANTPTRYYRDKNGNIYVKSWDFFDHGNYSRTDYNNEVRGGYVTRALTDLSQEFGNLLDEAGNPFVKTTGYKKVYPSKEPIVNGDIENNIVKEKLKRYNDNKNSMSEDLIRSIIGYDYFEKKYKGDVNKAIKDIFEGKYDIKKFGGRKIAQDGTYTVKSGDNLSTIAKNNGLSLQQIIRYNPDIKNPDIIKVGQQIKLGLDSPIEKKSLHNLKEIRKQEATFDNVAAIQSSKHNSNYAILDKNKQRMFIYDSNNNLLDSIPTITGASNEDYNTKTYIDANGELVDMKGNNSTPAGITEISSVGVYHGVPSFQRSRVGSDNKVRKGDDIASAMHFEYGVGQGQNRSNGCVRLSTEGAKTLGRYIGVGDRIYTLPQNNKSRFISKDGNLSFVADNVYGKDKGVKGNTVVVNGEIKDKYDWDDYNTTINKTYQPLYIDTKETGNERYDFNKRTFADALEKNKKQIQKELGLSSSEYNTLAMVAMGIADQETKFGTAKSYRAKQILDYIGLTDKLKKIEGNNTSKSLGVGQIKYGDDNKEIKEIYNKIGVADNHNDISNEAKAIIGRLYHIYRNQYQGGKEHYKNVGLSEEEALAYLYNGGNFGYIKALSENGQSLNDQIGYGYKNLLHRMLRNKTKTNKANYAKSVSNKSNNNEYYGYYKYGGIHIKPSKRGTFTAAAKKHGMSVQGFASKVLANKGKYSSAMVKKANFARNASKWKHKEFGGDMDFNYWITKDNIYKLGGRKKGELGLKAGQWGLQDYSNSFNVNLQPFTPTTVPATTLNVNNALALGIPNIIGAGLNLAGNIGSYFVNRRALRSMQAPVAPSAPTPLRAENLETRVSTAAQEAALRENVAKQENLIAGNLSSSRSRLNAVNSIRNQGIGLYNQLQERKQNVQTELINRAKLNRQQINNQNTLLANQYKDKVTNWRNSVIDFENKRKDALSENTIQHLIQGPIDAIAGERGFFANLQSNDKYRMTAFLQAITSPDALKAMNSNEIRQLAQKFGVRTSWLRSIGINV